ncbi:MAG: phospholipase A, partial [Pacificimonas sp.]
SLMFLAVLVAIPAAATADPPAEVDSAQTVTVVILNDGTEPKSVPTTLLSSLRDSGEPVRLTLDQPVSTVRPGEFARIRYRLERYVPVADLDLHPSLGFLVQGEILTTETVAAPEVARGNGAEEVAAAPASSSDEDENDSGSFASYKTNYALLGTSPFNAKLQFSFKYGLVDEDISSDEDLAFLRGVNFGFTQTMFWDLGRRSSPFRSIDFQPEILYELPEPMSLTDTVSVGGQAGLKHLSNGRDGFASRSFNIGYLEPKFVLADVGPGQLTFAPSAWFYFGDLSDNPDIDDFRGNTAVRVAYREPDGFRIEGLARGYIGTSGRGASQLDIAYPISSGILRGVNLDLHAQFFDGFGENLLEFDRRTTRFRIGVSLRP